MKLVILDGYSVVADDLSWSGLDGLAEVVAYDRTSRNQTVERCKDAEMVLTNKVVMDAEVMSQLPLLKYIGVLATGYNVVDTTEAHKRGIVVTNIPAYSTDSVVQMVWAHLLNVVHGIDKYTTEIREGVWSRSADFCYWNSPFHELADKQMGIVGLGNIGMKVATTALAFGMKVAAVTSKSQEQLPEGIKSVTLTDLLRESDVVSLNCPLTNDNQGMINRETLKQMKSSAILINCGRGGLVNEQDLADALNDGVIAAYCADVLTSEPASIDNPLLKARNSFLTPHIAWATVEARQRLIDICVGNVKAFIAGKVRNRV